jgi:hypothetical protein
MTHPNLNQAAPNRASSIGPVEGHATGLINPNTAEAGVSE